MSLTGNWSKGKMGGSVVSDIPHTTEIINTGHDDTTYYGGYLVAESIPEKYCSLIAAAPELLESLKMVEAKYLDYMWSADWQMIKEAIAKAEGR